MQMITLHLVTWLSLVNARLMYNTLSDRVVTTDYGKLRGVRIDFDEESLQPVEAYLGLQYASLLGGTLRYMPPTNPTEKWEGVKIANVFRPVCPQKQLNFELLLDEMPAARVDRLRTISEYTTTQSEECLFLNIYIPARDRKGPAPVVVFVHGESYEFGTGNAYDGSVLASNADITVVTLNYRLGPLGFLSTMDNLATGNYALFDLVAALHWIQTNIADFGGDSSQVTLMGHGYGAALANLLSLAPVTKRMNLFNRIVLQSGSALSPWAMAKNPMNTTTELARSLNCLPPVVDGEPLNTQALVRCLRDLSYDQLMNAEVPRTQFVTSFGPVIDKILLEGTPEQMMKKGNTLFSNVELMFGVAKYEGSNLLSQNDLEQGVSLHRKTNYLRKYVRTIYQYQRQKVLDILKHHYTDKNGGNSSSELKHKLIELLGDGQYNVPAILAGQYHLEENSDTYFYVFSHSSQDQKYPNYQNGHHGEELTFLFGAPLSDGTSPFPSSTYSKSEKVLTRAVMRFFGNFIKSGNPNIPLAERPPTPVSVDSLRFMNVYWPKYEQETQQYIQLGTRPLVNHHYRKERVALWTESIPKVHQKSKDGSTEGDDLNDNLTDMSTRGFDVRHVFPQPPTPPMVPPYREKTTIVEATTRGSRQKPQSDVVIEQEPVTQIVTKLVEVIKYYNKTILVTGTAPVQEQSQDEGIKMSLTLSLTIGIGSAFLFLNLLILIGIICQRNKLKTERLAMEKIQPPSSPTEQLKVDAGVTNPNQAAVKILDDHLYEKAMEQHHNKQNSLDKNTRISTSERSHQNEDVNMMEKGHRVSRPNQNGGYTTNNSAQFHCDLDTDNKIIAGVPQGPARAPTHLDPDVYNQFEMCGRKYSSGSTQHLREGSRRSSQNSLGPSYSQISPRSREHPIPRQRTSESLSRISDMEVQRDPQPKPHFQQPRSPRRQLSAEEAYHSFNRRESNGQREYDSQNFRKSNGANGHVTSRSASDNGYYTDGRSPRRQSSPRVIDESHYKIPRRLKYAEDGGSSDSGVQHMVCNSQTLS